MHVDDRRASKLLSLVLRHDPALIGVTLDRAGWVDVQVLLDALAHHGRPMSAEQLARVVRTSDKQRFALDDSNRRIRANQGHSVEVDLGLPASTPPGRLFHGTPLRNIDAILSEGLLPGRRHAVHLSSDVETAQRVGARRGSSVVLVVDAEAMHADGHSFTVSANGVWLVRAVPARYVSRGASSGPEAEDVR
jgi:putative RNA 2'-phosphotransferase